MIDYHDVYENCDVVDDDGDDDYCCYALDDDGVVDGDDLMCFVDDENYDNVVDVYKYPD